MGHLQDQEQLSELYEDSLEEDYVICNRCDGTGKINSATWGFQQVCTKCWGEGKLDWIENVVGKQQPYLSSSSTSSVSSTDVSSNHITTQRAVKSYVDMVKDYAKKMKGTKHDNKNISRGGTVQRFHKVSHKS